MERIIQATRALLKSLVSLPAALVKAPGSLGKKVWRRQRKGVMTKTEVRPLIETPVEIRLRAFAHLPAFLQEAGKRLEFRPVTQPTP